MESTEISRISNFFHIQQLAEISRIKGFRIATTSSSATRDRGASWYVRRVVKAAFLKETIPYFYELGTHGDWQLKEKACLLQVPQVGHVPHP